MRRIVLFLALVAVFLFGTAPSIETESGCWEGTASSNLYTATNAARSECGIPSLVRDAGLESYAQAHAARMADDETIYHSSVSTTSCVRGENVGMGPDTKTVQEAFLSSSGHRANILDRDYKYLGVGVAYKGDTVFVAVEFSACSTAKPKPKPRPSSTPQRAPQKPSQPRCR